jgi:hypothetical protein
MDINKLIKALNTASDDIPIAVYRQLVVSIAEALKPEEQVSFAMSCGIVSHELVETVSGKTL